MNHLISSGQLKKQDLEHLIQWTDQIRQSPTEYRQSLEGRIVATLFYEPSTRTRLSFETAVHRLGGSVIGTENAKESSSVSKGESLLDTIQVVAGYADAIVLRHHQNDAAQIAASISSVPVINAGGGSGEHPTQSLLDMYTIYTLGMGWQGLSIAMMGDLRYGRTIHSLVQMLSLYDQITIYGLAVPGLELPEKYQRILQNRGCTYIACKHIEEIPHDVDVLYQTRVQKERLTERQESDGFVIDQSILDRFSQQTILLHPLPRNREISPEVDNDRRAMYFHQAHNGVYVRMALLYNLFCDSLS